VRPLVRIALAALGPLACSCVALGWQDAVAEKVARDREKLHALDGIVVERGTVPGDPSAEVRSRLRFRAPSQLVLEVLEPEAYRGDVLAWTGSNVHAYSRRLEAGVRLRSVPAADATRVRAALAETTRFNMATYGYREGDAESVAGRETVTWTATPREKTGLGGVSRWWMDAETSFPLRVSVERDDAATELYSLRFEKARVFEPAGDDRTLSWTPPEAASWLDWDLAGPALPLEDARRAADFALLEPASDVEGLALARVQQASPKVVTVLALVYERSPYYASVSEQKDRGLADPKALGVPVDLDGVPGRISFAGDSCLVRFARDGVEAMVLTNLPPALALRLARSLRAKKP
jgi:hypothetical protein